MEGSDYKGSKVTMRGEGGAVCSYTPHNVITVASEARFPLSNTPAATNMNQGYVYGSVVVVWTLASQATRCSLGSQAASYLLVKLRTVPATMEQHGVVPDVLPSDPPATVQVKYGNTEVQCGNVLTPTQAKDVPHLSWPAETGALYTVCMTDPDAPSRQDPKFGEWQHWLVVNVSGNDLSSGETLSQYVGPGPPKGTGLHRYVFVVYRQGGRLTCDEPRVPNTSAGPRRCFKIHKFAEKYNLALVAGNFFQAEYDSHCDQIHKQLSI